MIASACVRVSFCLDFPSSVPKGSRFVLSLAAYFDASGTHQGSHSVSVAGYVSTPEQWEIFAAEWQVAMDEFDLDFFHMTDYAVRAPPYDAWTEDQRERRFDRLVATINRHAICSVGNVVSGPDYDRVVPPKAKRFMGGAYGLCANATFLAAAELLRPDYPSARISYIFDHGTQGAGRILKVFNANMGDPKDRDWLKIISLEFEDKKEFVPLQAADILAYELYQHLPRQLGASSRPPRLRTLQMLSGVRRDWGYLSEEQIRQWGDVVSIADDWHRINRTKAFR